MACVCPSLAACQRHMPSLLAAVIGLSNNDVISYVSYVACIALAGNPALVYVSVCLQSRCTRWAEKGKYLRMYSF